MSPDMRFIRLKRSSRNVFVKRGIGVADLADTMRENAYTTRIAATALMKRMNLGYAY